VILRSLSSWSTSLAFSAAGVTLLPTAVGALDRPLRIVVTSGAARHLLTGEIVTSGMAIEFDEGEAMDLEVIEDMTYWQYAL
jgi:enoyl-CoA hydratase/carnithine racemase